MTTGVVPPRGASAQPQRALQVPLALMPEAFDPLMDVDGVRRALKTFAYTEEDVLADLDEGAFEWAFDISSKKAQRREIRIYAHCVEQRGQWLQNPKWRVRKFSFDEVLRSLFPVRKCLRTVTSTASWVTSSPGLRLAFVCSPDLITDLIDEGSLKQMPGSEYRRGKGGAAHIEFESVKEFLSKRRL